MKGVWQKLRDFLLHDVASDFRTMIDAMATRTATAGAAQCAYDDEWETDGLQSSLVTTVDTSSSISSTNSEWDDGSTYNSDGPLFNPANGFPMMTDSIDVAGNFYGTSSDDFCSSSSSSLFDDY